MRFGQGVEVGLIFDQTTLDDLFDHSSAEVFYVHTGAASEVLERPLLADWVVFSDDAPCGLGRVALCIDAECF